MELPYKPIRINSSAANYLLFISFFITVNLFAQSNNLPATKYSAIIKGNVKNNSDKFWEFSITGYFNDNIIPISIDDHGNFFKRIEFDGDMQDISLHLNNEYITIYVQKNDTIIINWDSRDFNNTLKIKNTVESRNKALQAKLTLDNIYSAPFMKLRQSLYADKLPDSVKFSKINSLYNQEIQTLDDDKLMTSTNKISNDIYFNYATLLLFGRLYPTYDLSIKDTAGKGAMDCIRYKKYYKVQSEEAFKTSAEYRYFMFNYIRDIELQPMSGLQLMINKTGNENKAAPNSASWGDYYVALANLHLYELRDWFITKSIMFDFQMYSFNDACAIYQDFRTRIKTPRYADTITAFYEQAQRLKPGNMAPDFSLKDENGKEISLKSLRGKLVYIDFWGVHCGACLVDIKGTVPALHEKYKGKSIIFVNICVDSNEDAWKEGLATLNLSGINLIAPGWNKNPVCKDYGIDGIPHYFLIDENGRIADGNCPGPSTQFLLYPKLDKFLKDLHH